MNPIFNPKFTLVTEYPMMFSSSDLRHIELEMLHAVSDEAHPGRNLSEPLWFGGYCGSTNRLTEFYNFLGNNRFQLQLFRRKLEYLWEIDCQDSPMCDCKRSEKI